MSSPRSSDFGPDECQAALNVSRETMDLLKTYVDELLRWQQTINLVGPDTVGDIWWRHVYDSAQLLAFLPTKARVIIDMGSGAGFPGLVLALLLREQANIQVHLIESHQRKGAFLRHVTARTGAPARVHTSRLEDLVFGGVDMITARALAPLEDLLGYAKKYDSGHTQCLFLKGQNVGLELTQAAKCWSIRTEQQPSQTDPSGTILIVKEFHRVPKNT